MNQEKDPETANVGENTGGSEEYSSPKKETESSTKLDLNILLEKKEDVHLVSLQTMPKLGKPEFFCGQLKPQTCSEVLAVVKNCKSIIKMCENWRKVATAIDSKSRVDEEIFKWLLDLIETSPTPIKSTAETKHSKVETKNTETQVSKPESPILNQIFCCLGRRSKSTAKSQVNEEMSDIYIQRLTGKALILKFRDLKCTVASVKAQIDELIGFNPHIQFLFFDGQELQDSKTLDDYGVKPRTTLHLVQARSVLGFRKGEGPTVDDDGDVEFSPNKCSGLYRWHRDGQKEPDIYMGEFSKGRFDGAGQVMYSDGSYYRGEWLNDLQSGLGVQRWRNGAMYFGEWEANKENGWGAYYNPNLTPSSNCPYAYTSLFVGVFKLGCPVSGMLLECKSLTAITSIDVMWNPHPAESKDADVPDLLKLCSQPFRTFHVEFDGRSAFWQSPAPARKKGLFDMVLKLGEYEPRKDGLTLAATRANEEVWYQWRSNAPPAEPPKDSHEDDLDKPPAPPPAGLALERVLHTTQFYGVCMRGKGGQFPCPVKGCIFSTPRVGGKVGDAAYFFRGAFDGLLCLNENPQVSTPWEGKLKFALNKDFEELHLLKKQLANLAEIYCLHETDPDHVTHLEFQGEVIANSFPVHGVLLLTNSNDLYKVQFDGETVLSRFVSQVGAAGGSNPENKDGVQADEMHEIDAGKDEGGFEDKLWLPWADMEQYTKEFMKWLEEAEEAKTIKKIRKPRQEPSARKNETPVPRDSSDAMREAAKILSAELWAPNGILARRSKEFPQEAWCLGTMYMDACGGGIFCGWSKKVFCPRKGTFNVVVDGKCDSSRTEKPGESGNADDTKVTVDLSSCLLYPGSQDWFKYVLTALKEAYLVKIKVDFDKCLEQYTQAKEEDLKNAQLEVKAREQAWREALKDMTKDANFEVSKPVPGDSEIFGCFRVSNWVPCVPDERKVDRGMDAKAKRQQFRMAEKKVELANFTVVDKELRAARAFEKKSGVELIEASRKVDRSKGKIRKGVEDLGGALESLHFHTAVVHAEVEKLSKVAEKRTEEARPKKAGEPVDEDAAVQVRARRARIALEVARLNPDLAQARIAVARRTIRLLEEVMACDKALQTFNGAMLGKSKAQLQSKAALLHKDKLVQEQTKGSSSSLVWQSKFDRTIEDVQAEISSLREPTMAELNARLQQLPSGHDPRLQEERKQLEAQIVQREKEDREQELREMDLYYECQFMKARADVEVAQAALWQEWVRVARADDSDRPPTEPHIGPRLTRLEEVQRPLQRVLADARKDSEDHDWNPAPLASEVDPPTGLRKQGFSPGTACSSVKLTKEVARLEGHASKALRRAEERLAAPTPHIPFATSEQTIVKLRTAEKEIALDGK